MKYSRGLRLAVCVASAAGFTQKALQTDSGSRQDQVDDLEKTAEQLRRLGTLETNEGKTQHTVQSWCDGLDQGSKAVSSILAKVPSAVAPEASQEESDFKASAQKACNLQDKLFEKINNQYLADLRQEVTTGQRGLRGAAQPAQPQAQSALQKSSSGVDAGGADDADEDDEDGDDEEDESKDDTKTATTASKVKEASKMEAASKTAASSAAAASKSDSDEEEDDEEDGDDQEKNVNALLQKLQAQAKHFSFMQVDQTESLPAGSLKQVKQWCAYFMEKDGTGSGWMKTVQQAQDDSTAHIAAEEAAKAALLQQKEEIQARENLAQTWKQQAKSIGNVLAQMNSSIGVLKENLPARATLTHILDSHQQLLNLMQEVYGLRQKHVEGQEQHVAALEKEEGSAKQTLAERKQASEKSAEHLQTVHKQVAGIMKACKQLGGKSNLELLTQGMTLA